MARGKAADLTVTGRAADLGGEGEGGGPWWRRGAAATVTGRVADLGGDGAAATLAVTGRAADVGGEGEGGRRWPLRRREVLYEHARGW